MDTIIDTPRRGRQPSRENESRDSEVRDVLDSLNTSPLDIPQHMVPDDMDYRWCRKTVRGYEDNTNLAESSRLGWRAVPPDRHPGFCDYGNILGTRERSENRGYIEHNGLVLCERSKRIGQAIRAERNRQNAEMLSSLPGADAPGMYVKANKTSHGFQE